MAETASSAGAMNAAYDTFCPPGSDRRRPGAEADAHRQQVEHRLEEAGEHDQPVGALGGHQPAAEHRARRCRAYERPKRRRASASVDAVAAVAQWSLVQPPRELRAWPRIQPTTASTTR